MFFLFQNYLIDVSIKKDDKLKFFFVHSFICPTELANTSALFEKIKQYFVWAIAAVIVPNTNGVI